MAGGLPNRVRQQRESRGLSQVALAATARLTRQSIGAIEAGRTVPGVDVAMRIAAALDCTTEALFGEAEGEALLVAERWGAFVPGRVALAQVSGRWVTYPLSGFGLSTSADGIAREVRREGVLVEPLRPAHEVRENVVMMGCAGALGLLADRLNSRSMGGRYIWVSTSSTRALEGLALGHTHLAGVHLVDPRSGEANLTDVRRHAAQEPLILVTLARWEAGLIAAYGNPRKLRAARDLGRRGVRLVAREPGSGARRLLERELRAAGLAEEPARNAWVRATSHLEVAQAIALGAADVGVATRDVAIALGLHFIPLAEERYDLVLPRSSFEDARISRLLDLMTSGAARRELESLGYDVRQCGDRVAEIHVT